MTKEELAERRSLCFMNVHFKRYDGIGCTVPLEQCGGCKAFGYMPLGLETICKGGFQGILRKQQKKE